MSRLTLAALFVLALTFAPAARAQTQMGPSGKGSYLNVRGMMVGGTDGTGVWDGGGSVEWGNFQNKYFAAGSRLSLVSDRMVQSKSGGTPVALFFGGGPQAHIGIGEHFLLIPSANIGLKISGVGLGYMGLLGLGAAYRLDTFYLGAEAEKPLFAPDQAGGMVFLPPTYGANLLVGFYY